MQKEISSPIPLLDARGNLVSPGFARHMLFAYDRNRVKAGPLSLKEWDFYQISAGEWVIQLTIGHVSYMANYAVNLFSLKTGERRSFSRMSPLPFRALHMPENPELPNVLSAEGKDFSMRFETSPPLRRLLLQAEDAKLGRAEADITLKELPQNEKMVIATPFFRPGQFYLNCKANFCEVGGRIRLGDVSVALKPGDTALLDWGRGVWPYRHEWFWGNGAALAEGGCFGFNIGWGFGNTENATENMFFWNGRAHKLGELLVERDEGDYMAPWRFRDGDGRFDFVMTPVYDNFTQTKLALVQTRCHQVFGRYSGTAALPDGKKIEIKDLLAFCEHARNRW